MKEIFKIEGISGFLNASIVEFNDVHFNADSKLLALGYGLRNYYETYRIWEKSADQYFHQAQKNIIMQSKSTDFLIRYFASISFIHLSFEHFILEILHGKSSILSKFTMDKRENIVDVLSGEIFKKDYSNRKNIDYSIALDRVNELVKNHEKLDTSFKLDLKYHFIAEHYRTLKDLQMLRNNIIHSGKLTLNRYTYECFFVNQLLPLIRQYLGTQNPSHSFERKLHCGKNVIDEIIKEPLTEHYEDPKIYKHLHCNLRRINHFKELGRASFNNPIDMMEDASTDEEKKIREEYRNKRKRNEGILHVEFKQNELGHYKVHTCPCCGTQSLTTFDYWTSMQNQKISVEKAECAICSYRVTVNIGEPREFGIMEQNIFEIVL